MKSKKTKIHYVLDVPLSFVQYCLFAYKRENGQKHPHEKELIKAIREEVKNKGCRKCGEHNIIYAIDYKFSHGYINCPDCKEHWEL